MHKIPTIIMYANYIIYNYTNTFFNLHFNFVLFVKALLFHRTCKTLPFCGITINRSIINNAVKSMSSIAFLLRWSGNRNNYFFRTFNKNVRFLRICGKSSSKINCFFFSPFPSNTFADSTNPEGVSFAWFNKWFTDC